MSTPWWGRERTKQAIPPLEAGLPSLVPGRREALVAELRARIRAYTPEWRSLTPEDAGTALITLFGEQLDPVLSRLERLPEKSFVEFLSSAGIVLSPARPAKATLVFTASPAAPGSVFVGEGFQVGSPPVDDSPDQVIWETDRSLYVTAAQIAEANAVEGMAFRSIDVSGDEPVLPFGQDPKEGYYLLLGLDGEFAPGPKLTIGIQLSGTTDGPPPVAMGGVTPAPLATAPLLRWEVFTENSYRPAEVIIDDTGGLARSGALELRAPPLWDRGRPPGVGDGDPLRWLRLRLVYGAFHAVPRLDSIQLNMVPATAARTIRDEVLQPIGGPGPKRFKLSQAPVVANSLVLEVDEGGLSPEGLSPEDADDLRTTEDGGSFRRWSEVPSLAGWGPDARVYVLDRASGEIEFGNSINGMEPPSGFRNIIATKYQVGGGTAGNVDAGQISALVNSMPFLAGVTNPRPAVGGAASETRESAKRRGPHELKARGRAVTVADFGLLAQQAPGANVARAFAVSGLHPAYPGAVVPGVVGVFVIPTMGAQISKDGPPVPTQDALRHVADYLSLQIGPVGVQVVTAAPRYHEVSIELAVELDPTADVGDTVQRVLTALDQYLDPYVGGDNSGGWPFGGAIRYASLLRRVMSAVPAVTAIPYMYPVVDGIRPHRRGGGACEDVPISPYGLTWPVAHEVLPQPTVAAP